MLPFLSFLLTLLKAFSASEWLGNLEEEFAHHGDVDPSTGLYWGLSYPGGDYSDLLSIDLSTQTVLSSVRTDEALHTLAFAPDPMLYELKGKCITDKVLVFPGGKGSTGGSWIIMRLADNKIAPAAMINIATEPVVAVGSILANIPLVDRLDKDPTKVISTGDFVKVDADRGIVEVTKKS